MWILVLGLVIFLGIHSSRVFIPSVRENVIAKQGEGAWKGLYTAISFVGIAILVWGYGQARLDNVYFGAPPIWLSHLQSLLMVPVMILLIVSQLPAGRIKKVIKNPMLTATKIWAIGHLLVNWDLASFLLFGTFLAWAMIVVINTNRRGIEPPTATNTKSDVIAVVGGLVLWAAFAFWLHEWLIGVPVIAS